MFCYKCGEENPDEAKFCKNCGTVLKKEETVKKAEFIETPISNQHTNNNYQNSHTTRTTTTIHKKESSDWISCCICLIAVFIIFAIIGLF
ncbi:MAG: zinc-ribbon domain-containing protein [Methanobrevibacter sp.]|nr:zinc-ribbon domain-containing protein [Methanobrevibacter sp.]